MKKRFWNRLLVALCGLITAALGATLFSYGAGFFNNSNMVVDAINRAFEANAPGNLPSDFNLSGLVIPFSPWQRTAIMAVGLLFVAIGLYCVCELFRRNRQKGFIIQHAEHGDMSISMSALENMVKKCVQTHNELTAGNMHITRLKDGVSVSMNVTLNGGANIPLTVSALQKQIKQYITSCSGVDVKEVRVMVETNVNKLQTPEPVEVDEIHEDAQPTGEEPRVRSILSHVEEPSSYAEETFADSEPAIEEKIEEVKAELADNAVIDLEQSTSNDDEHAYDVSEESLEQQEETSEHN